MIYCFYTKNYIVALIFKVKESSVTKIFNSNEWNIENIKIVRTVCNLPAK